MSTNNNDYLSKNEAKVLNLIIQNTLISRAQLAIESDLTKASISLIIKNLLDKNLIEETGIGEGSSSGGRKPILLKFNGTSRVSLSIDVSFYYIEGLISYIDGTPIYAYKVKNDYIDSNNVISKILAMIEFLIKYNPLSDDNIIGLTIAVHGQVKNNHIIFTPYYDLDKIDLINQLKNQLPYPVFIENEANLAALGEYTFNSESENLISLSIHSGIGAGIIHHGKLFKGINGAAGEIGHTIFKPNGTPCPCGNKGCLEQYVSNTVIYKKVSNIIPNVEINSDKITSLYHDQHSEIIKIIEDYCHILSIGINNLIMLHDPEVIIINNSIISKIPELIPKIKNHLNNRLCQNIKIEISNNIYSPILLGGQSYTIQRYLSIQNLKLLNTI